MELDPETIPFSNYGCWMSCFVRDGRLIIQNTRRYRSRLFQIARSREGQAVLASFSAHPWTLEADYGDGSLQLAWADDQTLLIESEGAGFTLSMDPEADGFGIERAGHWRFFSSKAQAFINVSLLSGQAEGRFERTPTGHESRLVTKAASLHFKPDPAGHVQVRLRISDNEEACPAEAFDFDQAVRRRRSEWEAFVAQTPEALRGPCSLRAWYNLWSSYLRKEGCFHHDGILMSKVSMTGIWSWDHCFNGLAIGLMDREAGLEQIKLPYHLQAPNGALPDVWQVSHTRWIFAKPPVQGLTLTRLLPADYAGEDLSWLYEGLSRQANWWFEFRDPEQSGLVESTHPNDGGWDNATLFDGGSVLVLPDIQAYLILHMEWLEGAARRLGRDEAATEWRDRRDALLKAMLDQLWDTDQFCGLDRSKKARVQAPLCLETVMPLILGKRLPEAIFQRLVERLESDFLTDYGPATESPRSPCYSEKGYWRGPVWAPSTYLLVEGLYDGGADELGRTLAQRYCRTIEQTAGFHENHSATDGTGLCDPAYTWTASVYLLLKARLASDHVAG